jgi:hypothetical protein
MTLGRKPTKKEYEGSMNVRMDLMSGKLKELNDTQNVIVQLSIGRSHMFSYLIQSLAARNCLSSFVHVGKIDIDVPLRPMDVHSVFNRESKVIGEILPEFKDFVHFDDENLINYIARQPLSTLSQSMCTLFAPHLRHES